MKITFIIDFFRKFSIIKSAILGLALMLKIYNLSKKDLTMLKIYNLSKKDLTMLKIYNLSKKDLTMLIL